MVPIVLVLPFLAYSPSLENKVAMYWLMKGREQLFGFVQTKCIYYRVFCFACFS